MNEPPIDRALDNEVDDAYRRASLEDPSRPSATVRRAALEHAAQWATRRHTGDGSPSIDFKQPAANRSSWRAVIFGSLAAAALAGLLVTPHYFSSHGPNVASLAQAPAAAPRTASTPAAAPRASAPPGQAESADEPQLAAPAGIPADSGAHRMAGSAAPSVPRSAPSERLQSATQTAGNAPIASDAAAGLSASDIDPETQLRRAAQIGNIAELKTLLARDIAIEARDANGRTPLMLAALSARTEAVRVLLSHGANPNAADALGVTPLQAALAENESTIAAALLRAGARE